MYLMASEGVPPLGELEGWPSADANAFFLVGTIPITLNSVPAGPLAEPACPIAPVAAKMHMTAVNVTHFPAMDISLPKYLTVAVADVSSPYDLVQQP
jgi:hypothetical protein